LAYCRKRRMHLHAALAQTMVQVNALALSIRALYRGRCRPTGQARMQSSVLAQAVTAARVRHPALQVPAAAAALMLNAQTLPDCRAVLQFLLMRQVVLQAPRLTRVSAAKKWFAIGVVVAQPLPLAWAARPQQVLAIPSLPAATDLNPRQVPPAAAAAEQPASAAPVQAQLLTKAEQLTIIQTRLLQFVQVTVTAQVETQEMSMEILMELVQEPQAAAAAVNIPAVLEALSAAAAAAQIRDRPHPEVAAMRVSSPLLIHLLRVLRQLLPTLPTLLLQPRQI